MSSNNDTKFPESFRASEDNSGMNISDVFEFEEVMVWFKRCMKNYPVFLEKDNPKIMRSTLQCLGDIHIWYEKWFGQFRDKCQK